MPARGGHSKVQRGFYCLAPEAAGLEASAVAFLSEAAFLSAAFLSAAAFFSASAAAFFSASVPAAAGVAAAEAAGLAGVVAIGAPVCDAAKAVDTANSEATRVARSLFIGSPFRFKAIFSPPRNRKAYP